MSGDSARVSLFDPALTPRWTGCMNVKNGPKEIISYYFFAGCLLCVFKTVLVVGPGSFGLVPLHLYTSARVARLHAFAHG